MSKKNDAVFEKYLADVLATVPADKRAAVEEAFGTDGVKTKLREGVLAREDYSRSMDDLTASRNELAARVAEANAVHQRNVDWYATANQEYSKAKDKLSVYEQQFGAINDGTPAKRYLTQEDFAAALDQQLSTRDGQAIDVAVTLADLTSDHKDRFKEKLNTRELIKFATENRLSLDIAYDRFVSTKVDDLRKKEMDEAIAKARDEGAREALSKHSLPVISRPSESYSFESNAEAPKTQQDRVNAAVRSLNEQAGR